MENAAAERSRRRKYPGGDLPQCPSPLRRHVRRGSQDHSGIRGCSAERRRIRQIFGPTAEGHLFDNFFALSIHNGEDVLIAPTGDIDPISVGRESGHFGRHKAFDHMHDLVRLRVVCAELRSAFRPTPSDHVRRCETPAGRTPGAGAVVKQNEASHAPAQRDTSAPRGARERPSCLPFAQMRGPKMYARSRL